VNTYPDEGMEVDIPVVDGATEDGIGRLILAPTRDLSRTATKGENWVVQY